MQKLPVWCVYKIGGKKTNPEPPFFFNIGTVCGMRRQVEVWVEYHPLLYKHNTTRDFTTVVQHI